MNTNKAINYFRNYFTLSNPSETGWYRLTDPFDNHHNDKSMAVNFAFNEVRGYRTGFRGTIQNFIKEFENVDGRQVTEILNEYDEADYVKPEKKVINDEELTWPDYYKPLQVYNKRIYNYLEGRGFDIEHLAEKGFGYCLKGYYAFRIIIPFYINNKMVYWQARTILKYVSPKYLFPPSGGRISKSQLWYHQDELKWSDKLYINEGWADAEMYPHGLASSGWKLSIPQMELLRGQFKRNIELIIVADKGFYKKQVEQYLHFCDDVPIKILNLDNEAGKDTNEIGLKRVLKIERKTSYLSLMNLIELL